MNPAAQIVGAVDAERIFLAPASPNKQGEMATDALDQIVEASDDGGWNTVCEIAKAALIHLKHGDMDGTTCLLNKCELHYPTNGE